MSNETSNTTQKIAKTEIIRKNPELSAKDLSELALREYGIALSRAEIHTQRWRDKTKRGTPKKRAEKARDPVDLLLEGLLERETFDNKLADLDQELAKLNHRKQLATQEIDKEIAEVQRKKNLIKRYQETIFQANQK